jgi:ABC-type nitrate/sulfonate/bicarbonate transport system permease component
MDLQALEISVQPPQAGPARAIVASFRKVFFNLLSIVIFVTIWKVTVSLMPATYLPTPEGMAKAAFALILKGDLEGYSLATHVWASFTKVLFGFAIALLTGVSLGMIMGLYPMIYAAAKIIIEPLRFIPPVGWVPMAIVLLSGFSRFAFIIWLGAFFPIFISVLTSIPKVDPVAKDVVKVYGGNRWQIIKKIVIPSVMPEILAGARISIGASWMCIVAAEMIAGESTGLGRLILKYADLLRTNEVVAGMLFIGVIGLGCNEVILHIEKYLFKWRTRITF